MSRVGRAIVRVRLARDGQDVEATLAMSQAPKSNTLKMLDGGGERVESEGTRIAQQMLPMACMFLLWIAVFSSANWLLMSTIEEKSNKVIEVLLSAVSPMQLMSGKILGQCAVGLIMFGMYAGIGVAALVVFALFDLIAPLTLVLVLIYFLMAYFMIASMFAGIGSAVSDLREANTLMTPAMLILMVPMVLWMPISNDPNGMLATVTSFIPPVLPFVMVLRVTAPEPVPIWQIALSLLWGGAATIGFVWMSARIFRIGVLMQGKPPSPMELLKWIRYS